MGNSEPPHQVGSGTFVSEAYSQGDLCLEDGAQRGSEVLGFLAEVALLVM
jgi:hypothetical protein